MQLFEQLPNMLFFDDLMFVHAGIPRDTDIKEQLKDLSSLNDPDLRFQMLWSDPSTADFIPDDLQAQNARFPFGKLQFETFMARLGCSMMVRGHEKIDAGFKTIYGDVASLLSLFSAGGADNDDLPADSSYRTRDADGRDDPARERHRAGHAVADRLPALQRPQAQPLLRVAARDRAQGRVMWTVYVVRCADDTLYCGITNDLAGRLAPTRRARAPSTRAAAGRSRSCSRDARARNRGHCDSSTPSSRCPASRS